MSGRFSINVTHFGHWRTAKQVHVNSTLLAPPPTIITRLCHATGMVMIA
jgi:hypothetical protein